MTQRDLPALVRSAQAGNEAARDALFSRAARLAYARSYQATQSFDLAEDLAQEALLQALVSLSQLRQPESFLSWLKVIVDRVVATHLDHARRGEADHSVDLEALPDVSGADEAMLTGVDA